VLATPKAFIGDGGTTWGSSTTNVFGTPYILDQGDTQVDEATLRRLYLPPYKAAVEAGARSIMVSFSSWNGTKMHAHKYLLTDVLKGSWAFRASWYPTGAASTRFRQILHRRGRFGQCRDGHGDGLH
jgi:beta-glucosidase